VISVINVLTIEFFAHNIIMNIIINFNRFFGTSPTAQLYSQWRGYNNYMAYSVCELCDRAKPIKVCPIYMAANSYLCEECFMSGKAHQIIDKVISGHKILATSCFTHKVSCKICNSQFKNGWYSCTGYICNDCVHN
jgi:hypothetical protein